MTLIELLQPEDVGDKFQVPPGLALVVEQHLVNLAPWQIMPRDLAKKRLHGLRLRYPQQYLPFARRQDNDDLACLDLSRPGAIILVHDFADPGSEVQEVYESFWDWFRAAIEDMIAFAP
jgi:hypothetical protein